MEPKKIFVVTIAVFCFSMIALSASAGEPTTFVPHHAITTTYEMFSDADFQEIEQNGMQILRMEESFAVPFLPNTPASVHVNEISGPIVNVGDSPVMVFLFVGDAQSLQDDMMSQAVLAGVVMPGTHIDASSLVATKGYDHLSWSLIDAMQGVDIRAILVFVSADPIDGYFSGLEYKAVIGR